MNSDKNKRTKASARTTKTPSEYISFPKAAKLLKVGIATIRNLAKHGTLKTFTFGSGMRPRILASSVRDLLAKKEEAL